MRRLFWILWCGVLLTTVLPANAQEWHRHPHPGGPWGGPPPFHEHWHQGHWMHSWHEGRDGWWWIVDGAWFYYPAPIYPIPTPPVVVSAPPVVVSPPPVVVTPPPVLQSQQQVYYYCSNPQGYYPAVPSCPEGWQTVPQTPSGSNTQPR